MLFTRCHPAGGFCHSPSEGRRCVGSFPLWSPATSLSCLDDGPCARSDAPIVPAALHASERRDDGRPGARCTGAFPWRRQSGLAVPALPLGLEAKAPLTAIGVAARAVAVRYASDPGRC